MTNILNQAAITWLERRGISVEVAANCGLHSIRWDAEAKAAVPDSKGNVIAFPYSEHGRVVAEKYRGAGKRFWQREGGRKTFWNSDALDDPLLQNGTPLIITEGEMDALSAMTAGFPLAVSVPDGAPPPNNGENADDRVEMEPEGKFEFLWNNSDRLRRVKRFILAVDADEPGKRLAVELQRRLRASRCSFVEYPEGCKDLNEVLVKHGGEAVARVLSGARPYPVHGLYRANDYPVVPDLEVYPTGWKMLDPHLKLFPGEFMVVSGVPGHGKTMWTLNLMVNMARFHGWRTVMFSAEMPVAPQLLNRLRDIIGGAAEKFINDHFVFIDADPSRDREAPGFSLDWLLDRATDAVMRDGVRMFIIDPWNEIEHVRDTRESMTDYIGRSIRALKLFAKQFQVAVIVVAHPTKEIYREGKTRTPALYDVEGSAHWANKADHGVIIEREPDLDRTKIRIVKSRFNEAGERGDVTLQFDRETWRFLDL